MLIVLCINIDVVNIAVDVVYCCWCSLLLASTPLLVQYMLIVLRSNIAVVNIAADAVCYLYYAVTLQYMFNVLCSDIAVVNTAVDVVYVFCTA